MYKIGEDWIFQQYVKETTKQKLVEGDFYYDEDGKIVYTKQYLEKRKECCDQNCKHCPYNNV